MPALPVQCPRCTGLFQLDSAWFAQPIACPLCQDLVVILHEMSSGDAAAADSSDLLPPVRSSPLAEQSIAPDSADMLPPPVPTSGEAREPPVENLLPPGALGPASMSIGGPMPPPTIASLPASGPAPIVVGVTAPMIRSDRPRVAVHKLSPEEKAARRLRKNAIVFGLSIVVLIVVFYLLAR